MLPENTYSQSFRDAKVQFKTELGDSDLTHTVNGLVQGLPVENVKVLGDALESVMQDPITEALLVETHFIAITPA